MEFENFCIIHETKKKVERKLRCGEDKTVCHHGIDRFFSNSDNSDLLYVLFSSYRSQAPVLQSLHFQVKQGCRCVDRYCFPGGFPGGTSGKEPTCQCERYKRCCFSPWVRKIPGGEHGNPLQYAFLENSMDRGAWWSAVHTVTKSQT